MMMTQEKVWYPFVGPFDPCCPPLTPKTYSTPPSLYIQFQPMNLPQFTPREALRVGTLWPIFYSPYERKC